MSENDKTQAEPINLNTARLLVNEQNITDAAIVPVGNKWLAILGSKSSTYVLKTERGTLRHFKTLETAAAAIKSCGIGRVSVRLDIWEPRQGTL